MTRRVDEHVAAFNTAVRTSRWGEFAARFTRDARMEFVGVPVGPFEGRDSIAAAYAASPPDDTMQVIASSSDGDTDHVRFRWDNGGTGTMTLTWSSDARVAALMVTFD